MALTATAVPRVRDDIIKTLSMRMPHVAQSSYDRTNLEIKVCVKKGGREEEVTKMAKEIRKFFSLLFCVFCFWKCTQDIKIIPSLPFLPIVHPLT